MLTAVTSPVKLALDTTPEQQSGVGDIDRALTIFWTLVQRLRDAAERQEPIHQVEGIIFRDLLTIGLSMLRAFLASSGDGDVGPALTIPGESPGEPPQVLPRLDSPRSRPYQSIFGEVTIERVGSGNDRLDAAPLDARLHLPPPAILLPAPEMAGGPSSSTTPTPRPSRSSRRSWGSRSR